MCIVVSNEGSVGVIVGAERLASWRKMRKTRREVMDGIIGASQKGRIQGSMKEASAYERPNRAVFHSSSH